MYSLYTGAALLIAAFANADTTTLPSSIPHTIISLPGPSLPGPTARPTALSASIPTIPPTVFPSSLFASVLSISNCPSPILPSATSVTGLDQGTTAILTVQCDATKTFDPAHPTNCHAAFGIGQQRAYCCPMGPWSLTAFGTAGLTASSALPYYCYSSIYDGSSTSSRPIEPADPTALTQKVKRQVSAPLTTTGSVVLNDLIFVKAATTSFGTSGTGTTVVGGGGFTTTTGSMRSTTQSTAQTTTSTDASTTATSDTSDGSSTTAAASTTSPSSSTASASTSATSSPTVGKGSGAEGRNGIFGSAMTLLMGAGTILLALAML